MEDSDLPDGDAVARIVEAWRHERPDLDATPMLVVGRIHRLGQLLDTALRPPFADAGLGPGEFDVLAALRRAGAPYSRTPGELRDSLMVTSGAVTKLVDRLVGKGLATREVSATDARGRTVALTRAGRELIDDLIAVHLDNERRLLADLSPSEQSGLADLLATLTRSLEPMPAPTRESARQR